MRLPALAVLAVSATVLCGCVAVNTGQPGSSSTQLVSDLAARWAYRREPDGLVTWFEIRAEPPA